MSIVRWIRPLLYHIPARRIFKLARPNDPLTQSRWKQMREIRGWKRCGKRGKIPSLFSNDLFLHRLCFKLKLSYWFKIHQIRYFSYFSCFSFLFFFYNILVVHFYLLAYLYHLLIDFLHYSFIFYLLCLDCSLATCPSTVHFMYLYQWWTGATWPD